MNGVRRLRPSAVFQGVNLCVAVGFQPHKNSVDCGTKSWPEFQMPSLVPYPQKRHQAQVVQRKVDSAFHRINHYLVDSKVCFVSVIHPLNNWVLN